MVCDGKSMESTLLPLMDAIAAVGMRVMVSVKDWMQQSRDHRTGGPGSQVIPTPLRVLGRISPIFSPFSPVFCAFSPSRRGGSNGPQAGTQGQETVARAPKHRFAGPS